MHLVSLHTRTPFLIVECRLLAAEVTMTDGRPSGSEEEELQEEFEVDVLDGKYWYIAVGS
jgi:hypothetical protein